MLDHEGGVPQPRVRLGEVRVFRATHDLVHLVGVRVIRALTARQRALLVQQHQQASRPLLDQVNACLVVGEVDVLHGQLLLLKGLDLELEERLQELLVQHLVGVVDAQLLERVHRTLGLVHALEAEYVEHGDLSRGLRVGTAAAAALEAIVDAAYQPVKEARVERPGERVHAVGRLAHAQRNRGEARAAPAAEAFLGQRLA